MASLCSSCGYQLDAFDSCCPRCARGLNTVVAVTCPACQKTNPARLYACGDCDTRLPTTLDQIPKQPIEAYQRIAETYLAQGKARKAIITLYEACDFYPTTPPLRQRLVELLRSNGHDALAVTQERALYLGHIQSSEGFGIEQGSGLFSRGQIPQAIEVLQQVVHFHPHSFSGHEWLAACYDASGDAVKGQSERAIANQLKGQFQQHQSLQQQQAHNKAHSNETAAMAGGAAIGATGAVVGTGITLISIVTGLLTMFAGVGICLLACLLCLTCVGILPGIVMLGTGFAMIAAGFAVMIGGTAAGAATSAVGIAGGGIMAGVASQHRAARERSKKS